MDVLTETTDVVAPTNNLENQCILQYSPDQLWELRNRFPSPGNAINYVTLAIEGIQARQETAGLMEVLNNISTAVIETTLAVAIGRSSYNSKWDQAGKLVNAFGDLYTVIANGVNDKTGQVPAFERDRNIMDGVTFNKFKAARANGDQRNFFIFSPLPPDSLNADITSRGYGADIGSQIRYFQVLEDGSEECVTENFIDPGEHAYIRLFEDLIASAPQTTTSNTLTNALQQYESLRNKDSFRFDLWLMNLSGQFEPVQEAKIFEFIHQLKSNFTTKKQVIYDHITEVTRPTILQTIPTVRDLAYELLSPNYHDAEIFAGLEQIEQNIGESQIDLRAKIQSETGINMIGEGFMDYEVYRHLSKEEQLNALSEYDLAIMGCGFNMQYKTSSMVEMMDTAWGDGGTSGFAGGASGNLSEHGLFYDEELEYYCPCGRHHDINTWVGLTVSVCHGLECNIPANC